jgi:hypothetical protein
VPEFDPAVAELIQRGATAALLLDAQKLIVSACVELVLKKIDQCVTNDVLTMDRALGLCHELAAFRRIVTRQQAEIDRGRAARSQENGS